jgi:hypothetical protein
VLRSRFANLHALLRGTVDNAYYSSSHLYFAPAGEGYDYTTESTYRYEFPSSPVTVPDSGSTGA